MHNNFVIQHHSHVRKSDRNRLNNHKSGIVWFIGLSSSGKSTIAHQGFLHLMKNQKTLDLVIDTKI